MSKITAAITAVGAYVPEYVLTNQILETMVDTNDEWITTRTGIKERRILKGEGKGTSFLAIKAAEDAENITDVSPLHSKWVQKHSNEKIRDEIRLTKQFFKAKSKEAADRRNHPVNALPQGLRMLQVGF